jgi:hypothetical protein
MHRFWNIKAAIDNTSISGKEYQVAYIPSIIKHTLISETISAFKLNPQAITYTVNICQRRLMSLAYLLELINAFMVWYSILSKGTLHQCSNKHSSAKPKPNIVMAFSEAKPSLKSKLGPFSLLAKT